MNKVIIIGRLTRDADVRWSQGQDPMAVARFTLAVDRRYSKSDDGPSADFISCTAFGKRAEFLEKYGTKGMKFAIEGRIQTGSYTNRDGQKVYTTDVVVDSIEFVESKHAAETGGYAAPAQRTDPDGFMQIPDGVDEMPLV